MEPALLFATAFVVGLSGAMMPGPVTVVLTQHALRRGLIASPLVTLGHGILEGIMVVLLAFGLDRFFAGESVAGLIGLAGGAVLVWMGYGMVQEVRSGQVELVTAGGRGDGMDTTTFRAGVLATVSNPYWFLWWATVGASYVALSQDYGPSGIIYFFGGHLLSDFVWLSIVAVLLVTGKRFITDRIYAGLIAVLGLFLLGLGFYFFWSGINFLL